MLVLRLKEEGTFTIGDNIEIRVLNARHGYARIGIEAPREIPVHRTNAKVKTGKVQAAVKTLWGDVP